MSGKNEDEKDLNDKDEIDLEMSVKIYSPEKHYEWEHEVKQCDRIWSKLYEEFENRDEEYSLFFDLKILGRQFDIVIVTGDKVIVIEIKDKNGKITLTRSTSKIEYDDGKIENKELFPQCSEQRWNLFKKLLAPKYFNKEEEFNEDIDSPRYVKVVLVFPENAEFDDVEEEYPPYFRYIKEGEVVPQINSFRRGGSYPELDVQKITKLIKKAADDVSKWDENKIERRLKFIKDNYECYTKDQQKSQSKARGVDKEKNTYQQISEDLNSKEIDRVKKAIETVKYLDLDSHLKEIQELIESSNTEKKILALENLTEIETPIEREKTLKQFVNDEDIQVRKKADELMKFFGTSDSLKTYLDIIEESENYSRVMDAVEVIGNIGDSNAVSSLLKLYENLAQRFGKVLKFRAKRHSQRVDKKEAEAYVKRRYYSSLSGGRKKILDAIIEVSDKNSIKQLIDLYQNYESKFREELEEESDIRKQISNFRSDHYKDVLEARKMNILSAIKEIDPPSVVPLARDYLDPDDVYHKEAIKILGVSKNKDALKHLEKIIKSSEFGRKTRINAIEALGELGFEEGAEIIHEAIEKDLDIFKCKDVKNSLIKIGSQESFDFLIDNYSLSKEYAVEVLIEIKKKEFEDVLFRKLEEGNIDERDELLGEVSRWVSDYSFKISENRLSRFINILNEIVEKRVQIDDNLLEKVDDSIKNDGKKSNIDRIVKNKGLKYQFDVKEDIETFERLVSGSSLHSNILIWKTFLWKAEHEEKLPFDEIKQRFLHSSKPQLRKLGLDIIYEILRNHPDMADDVELDILSELKDDPSKEIILRALEVSEKSEQSVVIDEFDIEKSILRVLGFFRTEESLEFLLEYFEEEENLSEEGLKSLKGLTDCKKLENHCKENNKTFPPWIFDYEKIKNLPGISVQNFFKMIGFYWGEQVVPLFKKLLDENPEDKTLKNSIRYTLSNSKYEGNQVVLPLFRKLILDDDHKISSRAIRDFKRVNELHHSDDLVILKAAEENLDELFDHY